MGFQSNVTIAQWSQMDLGSLGEGIMTVSAEKYVIRRIVATNLTGTVTGAQGGIYTGANKTGTTIVAATQSYAGVAGKSFDLAIAAGAVGLILTAASLYLALSTKSSTPARADIYVIADVLD